MTVRPPMSRDCAFGGIATVPIGPIATRRLRVITISACGMISSPRIVIARTSWSTIDPDGVARGTSTLTVPESTVLTVALTDVRRAECSTRPVAQVSALPSTDQLNDSGASVASVSTPAAATSSDTGVVSRRSANGIRKSVFPT